MLNVKTLQSVVLMLALNLVGLSAFAAPDGKALFQKNCAQCHNRNMRSAMTGPALGGVQERWAGREKELYSWIRNSQALISSGDEYANKLFNEWNKSVMQSFPDLKDEEIEQLLLYVEGIYSETGPYAPKKADPATTAATGAAGEQPKGMNNTVYLGILLGVLVVLSLLLYRIIANLNYMNKVKAGDTEAKRKSLIEVFANKAVISFVVFALVVLGGYKTINNAIDLGRQQNYQPQQPIKFSHETHAGVNKINCQYCHDGARRSKHSVIPATNTCMNCHAAIEQGPTYGRAEISKIYASIGYNPVEKKYIQDYDKVPKKSIETIFRTWLLDGYADSEISKEEQSRNVSKQLKEIMPLAQKPIEWIRIHNLPDHAYFNHAQHVTVGKVECQTCHGPIEKMELVYQYSPLSMGWCINCHRQTEVQYKENPYYAGYEQYQEDLGAGKVDKITVENIGGLECQKCHY